MVSDAKVRAATGEGREHWFELLDGAGAVRDGWKHTAMAAFLVSEEVDPWWAQGITVAYEQARGLRQPGQAADGTFEASASKTLAVDLAALWPWLTDAEKRRRWLGAGYRMTGETPGKSVRLSGPNGARVVLNFYGPVPAGTPTGKQRLQAQVRNLPDSEAAVAMKEHWRAALTKLAALVEPGE